MKPTKIASAFAPATVGNAIVGFDILGFCLDTVGDIITVEQDLSQSQVIVEKIIGNNDLPLVPEKNTASQALMAMKQALNLPYGYRLTIEKGIPLKSGMGGSAASAVGAVVAANHLLDQPLAKSDLLPFALQGEKVSSGDIHTDNVVPCLFGGISYSFVAADQTIHHGQLPIPDGIYCILLHPHIEVSTQAAREILAPLISLKSFTEQTYYLTAFITALYTNNPKLISHSMRDCIITPQRQKLIPGFEELQRIARKYNTLSFGISGAGPSVFAWINQKESAASIQTAWTQCLQEKGVKSESWVSLIHKDGAAVIGKKP